MTQWPEAGLKARGNGRRPWTLDGTLPAREVSKVANTPGVDHVYVTRISGLRQKRARRNPGWFCVWGRIAIQIEGKRQGLIDVEDRLVLVKAMNHQQAKAKLSRKWREYSKPYLNVDGEMVRWKLTEVQDVYELFEDEIDSKGTEVYSRLRRQRMRASDRWIPAK